MWTPAGFCFMKEKINRVTKLFLLLIVFAVSAFPVFAATELPLLHPLFCDHAVLQRDAKVPVWGWTEPSAKVTVTFAGQTRTATFPRPPWHCDERVFSRGEFQS